MKMMKRVAVLAVLAAMLGVSAAAEAGTGRLDMMMQRGSNLKRCGPKGNGAKCGDGECCSKFGFCGTTPFHCDSAKGCESQCKEAKAGGSEPQPVVAESSSSEDAVQIVVKTISNAVPLCTDCPKAEAPAASSGSSGDDSTEESEESSEEDSSGSDADPVNPGSEDSSEDAAPDTGAPETAARGAGAAATTETTTDAGDVSPAGTGKVKSELDAIRKIQADGVAQAKQILADAKDKAAKTKVGPKPAPASLPKGPLDEAVNVLDREGY